MRGRAAYFASVARLTSWASATDRVLACTAMIGLAFGASAIRAEDNVPLALSGLVSGKNAGYFVALQKGFYKDEGLNVTISCGSGSGESQFGLADSASALQAQANDGSPVEMVAMMSDQSPVAALYVKEAGVAKLADLKGKTVARSVAVASVKMFPAFLKANDIDRSIINEAVATPSSFVALLLSRKTDAVPDQSSNLQRYRKAASEAGLTTDAFRFADYGLDIYGDTVFVSNDLIKSNPT